MLRQFLIASVISTISLPAMAQDEEHNTFVSISIENDLFGGGSDRFYTSGVRASWFNDKVQAPKIMKEISKYIPTINIDHHSSTIYTIGHNMYTPEDITIKEQPLNDRPWAAFLYGSVGIANLTHNKDKPSHIDEMELTLGVIGPEALGKPIQRTVHKYISDSPEPRGWSNQLNFEPGVILSWQRRIPRIWGFDTKHIHGRLEPHLGLSLGNIRTHVASGLTFVIGSDKMQDTPPRVRPAIPGTGYFERTNNHFDWQIFAGADARLVGRDIFLDGNTFSNSHNVDKKYLVGDLSAGASLFKGDYRLSYTINYRTEEFRTQDNQSIFGSISLTKRF